MGKQTELDPAQELNGNLDGYVIQVAAECRTPVSLSASAGTLEQALQAAWMLNRHTESPIEVLEWSNEDDEWRTIATVTVTWEE